MNLLHIRETLLSIKQEIQKQVTHGEIPPDTYTLSQGSSICNQVDRVIRMVKTLEYYISLSKQDRVIIADVEHQEVKIAYGALELSKLAIRMEADDYERSQGRSDEAVQRDIQLSTNKAGGSRIAGYGSLPAVQKTHILARGRANKRSGVDETYPMDL